MAMKRLIRFEKVSFSYDEANLHSLNQISFDVLAGEVLVFTGVSGCGKSTILKLINGIIPQFQKGNLTGKITFDTDLGAHEDIRERSMNIGTIFQNPRSQFFSMNTRNEMAFLLENYQQEPSFINTRIDLVAQEFELEFLLDRNLFACSGGEKQLIACASVAVGNQSLILLDEPSSNLDVQAMCKLASQIKRWKNEGKTVIIAEHRLSYLTEIMDRLIIVEQGKIAYQFGSNQFSQLTSDTCHELHIRELFKSESTQTNKKSNTYQQDRLRFEHFNFQYQNQSFPSLELDDFSIDDHQIIALVGKNGSGKSTFARCLCGLEKKQKSILRDKKSTLKAKDRINQFFLVMQDVNHQLFFESVFDEILMSMPTKDENRVDHYLMQLDLYDYKDRHPLSLSGGQKQRVVIACALASERPYLIFDEPTSGLDYRQMMNVVKILQSLVERERTIFLITHDDELIKECADSLLQFEKGKIKRKLLSVSEISKNINSIFEEMEERNGNNYPKRKGQYTTAI